MKSHRISGHSSREGRSRGTAASDRLACDRRDFPLKGDLFDGAKTASWLMEALSKTQEPILLCSGFLRSEALRLLLKSAPTGLTGKVLVRWRLGDLTSGASDLEAYTVAREHGLDFFLRLDFHGKVFCVPDQGVVLGSANATLAGLGLQGSSNAEVCTLVAPTDSNMSLIEDLFIGAHRVDDALFNQLSAAMEEVTQELKATDDWPEDLRQRLTLPAKVVGLLVSDCFWSDTWVPQGGGTTEEQRHDFALIGLTDSKVSDSRVAQAFRHSRMYRWLVEQLKLSDGVTYFGALAVALHDSLLDDPGPSRRDVKTLLQNLLSWCQQMPGCSIKVDQPNHSQRVTLIA